MLLSDSAEKTIIRSFQLLGLEVFVMVDWKDCLNYVFFKWSAGNFFVMCISSPPFNPTDSRKNYFSASSSSASLRFLWGVNIIRLVT